MNRRPLARRLFLAIFALATAITAQTVQAESGRMPYIDPALRQYFVQETFSREPVVVVALFEDQMQTTEFVRSRSYTGTRINMMRNALKSQERAVQALRTTESMDSQIKQLWIVNGMLIRTAAKDVSQLAKLPGVKALFANREIHHVDYLDRGYVSRRQLEGVEYTYGLQKLGIPTVREKQPQLTGKGVRVGILDTGIDAEHPDLKGKVANWKDFTSAKKDKPYDDNSHGTHVAGTIAGGQASGTAIGVAPEASLVVAKIFSGGGSTTLDAILQAMQWMADPDGDANTKDAPRLVSNSWGGGSPTGGADPATDVLCKAVDNWVTVGILPIFANGNSGPSPKTVGIPGACPSALGVGATDKDDKIASFSSRGPAVWKTGSLIKPDLSAPGKDVVSSVPGGGYKAFSGTSMATPHVSGLATLAFQAAPNASAEEVGTLMMNTAVDLGSSGKDNDFGTGRIDGLKALAPALGGERFGRRP